MERDYGITEWKIASFDVLLLQVESLFVFMPVRLCALTIMGEMVAYILGVYFPFVKVKLISDIYWRKFYSTEIQTLLLLGSPELRTMKKNPYKSKSRVLNHLLEVYYERKKQEQEQGNVQIPILGLLQEETQIKIRKDDVREDPVREPHSIQSNTPFGF